MTQTLDETLRNQARYWAGQMTSLARKYAPKHVRPAIHSNVENPSQGRYIIRTSASRKVAPDARAQEYGSGLRARRGAKKKYIIKPKTAPFLEFLGTNEFDGWLIRTKEVQHPGIQAANNGDGYLRPAAKEIRKRIKEKLEREGSNAIRFEIAQGFKFGMKK